MNLVITSFEPHMTHEHYHLPVVAAYIVNE